jgi:hypothetical protein
MDEIDKLKKALDTWNGNTGPNNLECHSMMFILQVISTKAACGMYRSSDKMEIDGLLDDLIEKIR